MKSPRVFSRVGIAAHGNCDDALTEIQIKDGIAVWRFTCEDKRYVLK